MAQMPRGEARTVPDPLGDEVEAAHRRERLGRERAEDAAARLLRSPDPESFSSSARLSDVRRGLAAPNPFVVIGGQTYREVDNGRANVLVPVDDPLVTPQERAAQQRAIRRAFFSAAHPIGGALDGVATLLGAPRGVRDPLLVGGAVLDTAATGLAPRGGSPGARKPGPPPIQTPARQVDVGAVRYGGLTASGQATGVSATVRKEMLGAGTKANPRITTPGLEGAERADRAHLLAKQLGGSGDHRENLVTATHFPTNDSFMKRFENGVARMVRGGEFVDYFVTPLYGAKALPPRLIMMTARGSKGSQKARVVENPAGRPR